MEPKKNLSFSEFLRYARKEKYPLIVKLYLPFTFPLSYVLHVLGFTANGVSWLGVALSIVGGAWIAYGALIPGLLVILFSYLLDFCDGNIARVHYGYYKRPQGDTQKLGHLLENLYANISYLFFFLPVGFYVYTETGEVLYLLLAVAAYTVKLIARYTVLHVCFLNRKDGIEKEGERTLFETQEANTIKYLLTRVIDTARVYFVSAILVAIVVPQWFSIFFAGYCVFVVLLNSIKLGLTLYRKLP